MPPSIVDTIRNRRTIHNFRRGELPSAELIKQAIEQAIWAPNHHLSQPWRFQMIGAQTAERICRLNAELVAEKKDAKMAELKLRRWREIPGWLLLSCENSDDELRRQEDYAACCCVAQNLALILWESGVGMKWTTGAVCRDPRFYDIVQVDSRNHAVVGLFWYGYPAEIPQTSRRPVEDFINYLP